MTVLEYLDRVGERRAARMHRPRDIRQFIGFAFLFGYYVMLYRFLELRAEIPAANLGLIRDAMLTLGPPIGIIIGAMFRSDAREEQATANTGEAFQAIKAAAKAGTGLGGEPQEVTVVSSKSDPVHTEEAAKK